LVDEFSEHGDLRGRKSDSRTAFTLPVTLSLDAILDTPIDEIRAFSLGELVDQEIY
jgi:hypothetical protein